MSEGLHPTQKAILGVLKRGVEGLSLRDIAREIGVRSPATVVHHLRQLEKKGYLRRNPASPSDYTLLRDPVKDIVYVNLYGLASCGSNGFLTEENVLDRIPLSTRLFGVTDHSFLVRAWGDSMEPMISDRDLILVEQQPHVETNTVALVICGEEPRIKKVIFAGDRIVLASLNPSHPPEVYGRREGITIVGKVKSVIKFTG
jgi:repressor LexA